MKRFVTCLAVASLLLGNAPWPAYAGHVLVSATMTWKRTGNPGEVEFEIKVGVGLEDWAAGNWPVGSVQTIPESPIILDFGDGSPPLDLSGAPGRVVALSMVDNWTLYRVDQPILHTYPLVGSFTAVAQVSCHPHFYLVNREGEIVRLESKVDLSLSRPPSIDVPPILIVHPTASGIGEFRVPYGQLAPMTAHLRGATDLEAGSCCNPPLTIETTSGPEPPDPSEYVGYVKLDDATLPPQGRMWTAQLVAENVDGLKTATDFTIRIGPPLPSQADPQKLIFWRDSLNDVVDMVMPNQSYAPVRLMPGEPLVMWLVGANIQDPDPVNLATGVELTTAGYPSGATTANMALPAPAWIFLSVPTTLTWVPTRADVRSHAFNFVLASFDFDHYGGRLPTVVNVLDPRLIAGGYLHAVGVRQSDSAVMTWGINSSGCLGRGPIANQNSPGAISGFPGPIRAVDGGLHFTVVLKENGEVWGFGNNSAGQLGQGDDETRTAIDTPVQVKDPNDPSGFLQNVIAISANAYHCLAVKADGTLWSWGQNSYGKLGDGTSYTRKNPVQVKNSDGSGFLEDIISAKAGFNHSLALTRSGEVLSWGSNLSGQLGDGSYTSRSLPGSLDYNYFDSSPVVTAIEAGNYHSVALNSHLGGGVVITWGGNTYGELGRGTTGGSSPYPMKLGLTNITRISSKYLHSLAIKRDGTVVGWGSNLSGQLGTGAAGNTVNSPVSMADIQNAVNIGTGTYYSFAVRSDGTARSCGSNSSGQLGIGSFGGNILLPTPIVGGAQF